MSWNYPYDSERPAPLPLDLRSVRVAAIVCGLSTKTIYKYIADGTVSAWGRRNSYRVSIAELLPPVQTGGRKRTE